MKMTCQYATDLYDINSMLSQGAQTRLKDKPELANDPDFGRLLSEQSQRTALAQSNMQAACGDNPNIMPGRSFPPFMSH